MHFHIPIKNYQYFNLSHEFFLFKDQKTGHYKLADWSHRELEPEYFITYY
jgi:hypothetical protein